MSGWPVVRLGDVCDIRIGRTPSRANPAYWGPGYPWASISDLARDPLDRTRESVTELAVRECRLSEAPAGTLLYSFKLTIGKMAVAAMPVFTNEAIAALRVHDGLQLDRDFVRFALTALDTTTLTDKAVKGRTLNSASLADLPIPLPPLHEQRRIAARLRGQLAEVEALARALEVSRLELSTASRTLIHNSISNAPTHGHPIELEAVADIQLGKMLSPAAHQGLRPLPYLRNANVQWDRIDIDDVAVMDFAPDEEKKFSLRVGDVLVCEGGEPGRAAIWDGRIAPCAYQKALHRVRPLPMHLDAQFLVYRLWLGAMSGEFAASNATTTIAHLPAVRLKGLRLALPRVEEQRLIAARLKHELAEIDQARTALDAQRAALDVLPAAILREAFGPS